MSAALYEEGIVLPGAVTVEESAAVLGVSTKWVFRRVKEGRLHVVGRDGRCLLIATSPASICASIRASTAPPPSAPYSAYRPGELCRIVCVSQDSATVTITGPRAVRVLASVIPRDRQIPDREGWRVPTAVLPLRTQSPTLNSPGPSTLVDATA